MRNGEKNTEGYARCGGLKEALTNEKKIFFLCHADKPETIDALKLHTNDNVLKNWTDRVDYCMASQVSQLLLLFIISRKDCTFK